MAQTKKDMAESSRCGQASIVQTVNGVPQAKKARQSKDQKDTLDSSKGEVPRQCVRGSGRGCA